MRIVADSQHSSVYQVFFTFIEQEGELPVAAYVLKPDYGDASLLLINSRNNHIKARYGFLQSLSKLRLLQATDDEELLVKILLGE